MYLLNGYTFFRVKIWKHSSTDMSDDALDFLTKEGSEIVKQTFERAARDPAVRAYLLYVDQQREDERLGALLPRIELALEGGLSVSVNAIEVGGMKAIGERQVDRPEECYQYLRKVDKGIQKTETDYTILDETFDEEVMNVVHQWDCNVCSKPRGKLCARCRSVRYCSSACQTTDWPRHKQSCRAKK